MGAHGTNATADGIATLDALPCEAVGLDEVPYDGLTQIVLPAPRSCRTARKPSGRTGPPAPSRVVPRRQLPARFLSWLAPPGRERVHA